MNYNHESSFDLGSILGAYVGTIIFIWAISAIVASAVAPVGRQLQFFVLTLLFLGPLGVGFAAVAVQREAVIPGRQRFVCPRCAAAQYVDAGFDEFDCWRCDQLVEIEYRRFFGPRVEAMSEPEVSLKAPAVRTKATPAAKTTSVRGATKPKTAPKSTPAVAKKTAVRCHKCQHVQQVLASATEFDCEKCAAKLTRAKKT